MFADLHQGPERRRRRREMRLGVAIRTKWKVVDRAVWRSDLFPDIETRCGTERLWAVAHDAGAMLFAWLASRQRFGHLLHGRFALAEQTGFPE